MAAERLRASPWVLNPPPDPTMGSGWVQGETEQQPPGPRGLTEGTSSARRMQHHSHTDLHRDAGMPLPSLCSPQPQWRWREGPKGWLLGRKERGDETCTWVRPRFLGWEREERRARGCSSSSVLQDGLIGLVDVLGHLRRAAFQG